MTNWKKNKLKDKAFSIWGIINTLFGIVILGIFIAFILYQGLTRLDWEFLTALPSRFPEKAGIYTAIMGSLWLLSLVIIIAIPLGIAAAIYLEEYVRTGFFAKLLEINISNLAGVPSIIYGLLGLELFARVMNLGGNLIAGALTLSLLILPIIVVATREAIRAVPFSIKEASYALGASKWQTIWEQVLPSAFGGILTGIIIAMSRAIGEAAPLIVVGALAYVPFAPSSPMDEYTVLPIQIFNWISRPQHGFIINAAAGIIVLLSITFVLNAVAVYLRNKYQKNQIK